jgi:hypothetical protein
MEEQKSRYSEFLRPQEEMLEVGKQRSSLTIGVPKETGSQENRVVLVPDGVGLLTKHGHQVLIEAGAGIQHILPITNTVKLAGISFIRLTKFINRT